MEDEAIIKLYFARKEEALEATSQKYGSYCYRIARNILPVREDAQEAVNDTYFAAWNAIPPHIPRSLAAFLGKITRRISLTRWEALHAAKRGGNTVTLALEELNDCLPAPGGVEEQLEAAQLTALLETFLRSLPGEQRQVFLRRYWYLESIARISADLGCSQSKVKSILHRSRSKLRILLEKEGIPL